MFLIIYAALGAGAGEYSEIEKIEGLLARLESMDDMVFIRNGKEYRSKEATEHLRLKWRTAGARIRTAEDFIKFCGSKSSTSGKVYRIRFADGRMENSADVLTAFLREIEKK